jgi:nucleoid-associated protein YgaU
MAQISQFGTPAKVAVGGVVVAVVALAAYFVQPKVGESPAPVVAEAPAKAPTEVPTEAPKETSAAAEPILPTLDVVRVTPEGEATIAGTAAPEATVSLRLDGAEIASASADGTGAYASLFSLPASDKARILTLVAKGIDGVEVLGKDQVVLAPTVLPQVAAAEPTTEPTPEIIPAPLKITDAGVQVLEPAKIADNIVVNSISYENDMVKVGGLGQADQSVRLYVDGTEAGSAQIAANGTWSASLKQIAAGVYTLRADQLDKDGKVTSRYETPFKRESSQALAAAGAATTPEANAATATEATTTDAVQATPTSNPSVAVTVQPGLTLWAIAQQSLGSGTLYIQVFEANKDQIRDPNLIYPGQVFTIPKQ